MLPRTAVRGAVYYSSRYIWHFFGRASCEILQFSSLAHATNGHNFTALPFIHFHSKSKLLLRQQSSWTIHNMTSIKLASPSRSCSGGGCIATGSRKFGPTHQRTEHWYLGWRTYLKSPQRNPALVAADTRYPHQRCARNQQARPSPWTVRLTRTGLIEWLRGCLSRLPKILRGCGCPRPGTSCLGYPSQMWDHQDAMLMQMNSPSGHIGLGCSVKSRSVSQTNFLHFG